MIEFYEKFDIEVNKFALNDENAITLEHHY